MPDQRTMELEELDAGRAEYNPREELEPGDRDYEQIKQSLQEFGMVRPFVWNERTETLVEGHQRLTVMMNEDMAEEWPVWVVDLPPDREKALNVALNQGVEGRWDEEGLGQVLYEVETGDPEIFDELGLGYLEGGLEIDEEGQPTKEDGEDLDDLGPDKDPPPEMELQPFEHYDYVVILADDERDWKRLMDLLDLEPVRAPDYTGDKRIGLGRAVRVKKLLRLLQEAGE